MRQFSEGAFAKVNLTLDVLGTREDGYHNIRSIMQTVSLHDDVIVNVETGAPWQVHCYREELPADAKEEDEPALVTEGLPQDADNLAWKAAEAFFARTGKESGGLEIFINKRIPMQAGLGGGSADAAATLRALNVCWGLGRSVEELAALGARIGSDVPALVLAQETGGPVWMEGRGERVRAAEASQIPPFPFLVLVHPGVASSTAEVYARCTPRTTPPAGAVNDLQAAACAGHPEIATALAALVAVGAQRVMMSGSGSVVYGFAPDAASAQAMAARMRALGCSAWVTRAGCP